MRASTRGTHYFALTFAPRLPRTEFPRNARPLEAVLLILLAAPRLLRTEFPRNAGPLEAASLVVLASRHPRTRLLRDAGPFEAAFERSLLEAASAAEVF